MTPIVPEPDPEPGDTGLTGQYAGSTRCLQCHNNIHTSWAATLHAKALESLEAIGQDKNADCIGCHTVGFGEAGGFVDRATTNSLAGVGCESCHGPSAAHANNVNDATLRPPVDISSAVCGKCHTGEFHPTFEDWSMSKHAAVGSSLVSRFAAGQSLNSCGKCHSGDYFYRAIIKGETIADDYLQGQTGEQMAGVTCAICHNPHSKTGNAAAPEDGRDYQLRFAQIKYTTPTTDLAATQDGSRFNLCGQCHHTRERVWTDTSREPHPSDQVNVFFGEMPLPASDPTPLVPSRPSVHLNTAEQCSTCHVARKPIEPGIAPAVSGHTFEVNFLGCVDCHGTVEISEAKLAGLEVELDFRAEQVREALDAWATRNNDPGEFCATVAHTGPCWEFTSEGGPPGGGAGQGLIPDEIKKARYIYYYVISGGGNGVHNPDYVREALILAKEYAETAPDIP